MEPKSSPLRNNLEDITVVLMGLDKHHIVRQRRLKRYYDGRHGGIAGPDG